MDGMLGNSSIGPVVALAYAGLMFYAYGSQIFKLYNKEDAKDISAKFFLYSWMAIGLRALVVGVIFLETQSLTAIILGVVEVLNFLGRIIIFLQIKWYRDPKNKTSFSKMVNYVIKKSIPKKNE